MRRNFDLVNRSEFLHEALRLFVWIGPERYENLICLGKIDAPLTNLDPGNHSMLPPQRNRQIALSHVGAFPKQADVFAKHLRKDAVSRLKHALIFATDRLASKMRAE